MEIGVPDLSRNKSEAVKPCFKASASAENSLSFTYKLLLIVSFAPQEVLSRCAKSSHPVLEQQATALNRLQETGLIVAFLKSMRRDDN